MKQFTIADWLALASVIISFVALIKSFLTDRKAKKNGFAVKTTANPNTRASRN